MSRSLSLSPRTVDRIGTAVLALSTVLLALRFLELHSLMVPARPPTLGVLRAALPAGPPPGYGWWSWWDQSLYLEAALAWSHASLDPALHWYLPGYAMLAAPFVRIVPSDPFMVPNLLCLLGALWLFAALAQRLWGRAALGRSLGAAVFLATTAASKLVLWAWVVPWTTTPETVCILGCLLAAVRLAEQPAAAPAFWAGVSAGAILAFRPADAALVGGACAAAACGALAAARPGWRPARRVVAAGVAGAALPAALVVAVHLAIHGPHLGRYLLTSAQYGFEWRLLPLRWVLIMIDPRPLFADGRGLAAVFPWIVSGTAGMLACLVLRPAPSTRTAHCAVVMATAADVLVLLCYRDLHPDYLWHNGTYHYFKWTLPVFGLYSLLLLRALVRGPRLVPAAAAVATAALFMWRVAVTQPTPLATPAGTDTLLLPHGLSRLDDVLFARTTLAVPTFVPFGSELRSAGQVFRSTYDFKVTSWPQTLMVQPIRILPDAPSTLHLVPDYVLDPAVAPVLARQTVDWGIPCPLRRQSAECQPPFLLPLPLLPLDRTVVFGTGGDAEAYRFGGLSASEPAGDWTDGLDAAVAFRLPPDAPRQHLVLQATARGFAPTGRPSRVTAYVNGVEIGRWRFGPALGMAESGIPESALRPDGSVLLELAVATPRSPTHYTKSGDTRMLGIQLRSMRLRSAG